MNKVKKDKYEIENVRGHFIVKYNNEQISVEDSYQEAEQFIESYKASLNSYIVFYEYLDRGDRWVLSSALIIATSLEEAERKFKDSMRRVFKNIDVRLAS